MFRQLLVYYTSKPLKPSQNQSIVKFAIACKKKVKIEDLNSARQKKKEGMPQEKEQDKKED
jgi:hypothetical protein